MVRSATADILIRVNRRLAFDARSAAGSNNLVSRPEQDRLPDALMKNAADDLRAKGGRGARVEVDALVGEASGQIEALLRQVNQRSGTGASWVSAPEVRALLALNRDAGKRVARAYELITGKRITIPEEAQASALDAARIAQIASAARAVAMSGDMMNGEIPHGNYRRLEVLRDDPPRGRTYTVFIPLEPGEDPNTVEDMWLLSVDDEGIQRTATFGVPLDLPVAGELTGAGVVANLLGAIDGLARWHESGDNGVDTRVVHLGGAPTAQAALEALLAQASAGRGGALVAEPDPLSAFRTRAASDLEAWRETFYDGEPVPASDEATAAMTAFDDAITAVFASLPEVRLARGNDDEGYLLGRVSDGFVGVVIWPYRDG